MDSSSIKQLNSSTSEASVSTADEKPTSLLTDQPAESLESQQKAKARAEKAETIRQACDARDIETLISSAITKGGLLDDELRQRAWPILLQCDESTRLDDSKPLKDQSRHLDEDQVQLDVDRSFVYYPSAPAEELSEKKKQLSSLITQILRNHPMLCYFQGYHDIVQVLLLVLGKQKALPAMTQLSLFRIRDYMLPSLSPAVKHLQLIPAIIETVDPVLRHHLSTIQPFFALAATLTLYAHDIQEYSDIARLFDYLLAREPVVAIYLFAAIILSRKEELLDIPLEEPEMLHFKLSKLPYPLDLDSHISSAERLFKDHPPESLPSGAWKHIPSCSVLKTTRDPYHAYTVKEAERLFKQQTRQLQNEERRQQALEFAWKHRRAVGSVALAILVGAASIYIRKKGLDTSIWSYVGWLRGVFKG
ncbi:Cytochrome 61 [Penicillium atrosanguineum]|uniref:Cytochrome 61 n=1 Tax=Penicillium atrosanguineum TaxID=1132637 RepID=UPI0023A18208|nr:Cytochrome 61 [Penicillium atrosanguineum]KAJ5309633.1 Cytochrome 61 [Penicillium atrosanguineum]